MNKLYLTLDLEIDPWTKKIPEEETIRLLNLLRENNMRMTVFALGRFAETNPDLLSRIVSEGHELGLHGYNHERINSSTDLKQVLERSRLFIEKYHPYGFRAPYAYLPNNAIDLLKNYGFKYDSSSYSSTVLNYNSFLEIPITTIGAKSPVRLPCDFLGCFKQFKFPIGSGLFSGWCPNLQTKLLKFNSPAVLLLHPWQFTNHSPFGNMRLIPYLRSCWKYVETLPIDFRICPLRELYEYSVTS